MADARHAIDESQLHSELAALHRQSYAWALNCCRFNVVDAENALQSVYLKILQGRAIYLGRSAFRTWLFAVIRLTAAEERRRSFVFGRRLVDDPVALAEAPSPDEAVDVVYRREIHASLRGALASLAPRQREVLHLVFYEDMTLEEAARVMRISIGSTHVHYARGKRRLRDLLPDLRETTR
jgi:RNA polymerase sigma-70 factor (ECF subfamily)